MHPVTLCHGVAVGCLTADVVSPDRPVPSHQCNQCNSSPCNCHGLAPANAPVGHWCIRCRSILADHFDRLSEHSSSACIDGPFGTTGASGAACAFPRGLGTARPNASVMGHRCIRCQPDTPVPMLRFIRSHCLLQNSSISSFL